MASKARNAFDNNARDIERLLELHTSEGGPSRGRRVGLEVLNKSAIVLLTAFWEAYCEDIAAEALEVIVAHAGPDGLSKELRQRIAQELKATPNELTVWQLADDGWRDVLRRRLEQLRKDRNRRLNAPKAAEIDKLFLTAIGLPRVSDAWSWQKMPVETARAKLDGLIELRGSIAHRGRAAEHCYRAQVEEYFEHVKRLVGKTGGRVNSFVSDVAGRPLWT